MSTAPIPPTAAPQPPAKNGGEVKAPKEAKAPKAPKAPKEPKVRKASVLAAAYPKDAKITVLIAENPKRAGTMAAALWDGVKASKTVADYLAFKASAEGKERNGTLADLAYNVGHGFIKIG